MKELLIELDKCLACKSCELACAVEHSTIKSLIPAIAERPGPVARVRVGTLNGKNLPMLCRHCEEPACVMACMSGALMKDEASGLVVQREDKCVGCSMCIMVCAYSSITTRNESRVAIKCDRCPDREDPACISACPTKAISLATTTDYSAKLRKKYLTNFKL